MEADVTKGTSGLHVADEQFVHEWLSNGYKISDAYLKVWPGVSRQTASVNGNKKLKDPTIAAYASGILKSHLDKYEVTEDRIIEELANIAFLDVKDVVDKDGVIDKIHDMPEKARRAVASVTEGIEGRVTVKFCNKEKALELLAKYKKLLTELHEISGDKDLVAAIMEARKRVGIIAVDKEVLGDLLE